ncbi:CU044_5270 family protein [Nonomuraea sp. NN258]|uniref:CU044_5270 family protein n=1 Tax=Nonomuraea antri TaxID=2730852 RepID=UPI001569896A|nr:CU044_5270 family protein [Nonomuraea antri]NRQ36886.1 CU044_5270 family protein [Nonomuraea antri]
MNGPLAGFEERRLAELKEQVAARAAAERERRPRRRIGVRVPRALTPRAPKRRRWVVPSLLAAAAATAALVVVTGTDSPAARQDVTLRTTPVSAEAVLRQAALVVQERRPIAEPRPEQWIYRKLLVQQATGGGTVQEYWTRYDGRVQVMRQGQGPFEKHTYVPDPADDDLTPQEFAAKLAALPTDPHRLLAQVKADRFWAAKPEGAAEEPADDRAFRVLSVYLDQEVPLPPELHAAIFRALAEIPNVRVDVGVRDAAGRPGVGIAYEPGPAHQPGYYDKDGRLLSRSYLVLDPTTYEYLGRHVEQLQDEVINGEIAFRKGTASFRSAVLARGVFDRPGELPR